MLVALVLVADSGFHYWFSRSQQRQDEDVAFAIPLTERVSPDAAWKAYIDLVVHQDADHPILQGADTVFLMDMHNPSDSVPLLMVTDDSHADNVFPVLVWKAPTILQVTVANRAFVKMIRQDYKGIHVELRFDPDDPAARNAWLNRRDHKPEWPPSPAIAPNSSPKP